MITQTRRTPAYLRILALLAVALGIGAPLPPAGSLQGQGPPGALTLVTDRVQLPLSDRFGPPTQVRITAAGDALFAVGFSAVFTWDATSGARTPILQSGGVFPGFPGSVNDFADIEDTNAAGHATTGASIAGTSHRFRGVFLFDGNTYRDVAVSGDPAPGTGGGAFANFRGARINDSDQVAFVGQLEPRGLGPLGIFLGSAEGTLTKIAFAGDTAPGTGGGTYSGFTLIDVSNTGEVAFEGFITGGTTSQGLFIGTGSGVTLVAASGDPALGTGGTFVLDRPRRWLVNAAGQLAFESEVTGGIAGIWVGSAGSPPVKLMLSTDATGTGLGGTFGSPRLHGFNAAGEVLFQSTPVGAAMKTNHALFLKDLAGPAQIVFARNQPAPGGTTETFNVTQQALLNEAGDVAFLATLRGGPVHAGWFLRDAGGVMSKIALQGEPTPAGGTFGLSAPIGGPDPAASSFNANRQLAFIADLLGPNGVGAFRWSPGTGIVAIVQTDDTLPRGAARTLGGQAATDDHVFFNASLAGGRGAVFRKPLGPGGGNISRLVGDGDPAPGTGGRLWGIGAAPAAAGGPVNDHEQRVIGARIVGGSVYPASGIFVHSPGAGTQKLAATGDPVPGAAGGLFHGFGGTSRINSSGAVAFWANVSPSGDGIFVGSIGGGVHAVARSGDASPVGGTFTRFFDRNVPLNDSGKVAFRAVSTGDVAALLLGSGTTSPVKIVARGDAGPGVTTVETIPNQFRLNNLHQVAYVAGLSGSATGVFLGTAGGPQMKVALAGDPAPGTAGGTFKDFVEQGVQLNNPGAVAFWARVDGSPATTGIFLGSATAPPVARIVEGQALPDGVPAGFLLQQGNLFMALADTGELCIIVANGSGGPDRRRSFIADTDGNLRAFAAEGERAPGTGSFYGEHYPIVRSNSAGRFFTFAWLVSGPAVSGIFTNTP